MGDQKSEKDNVSTVSNEVLDLIDGACMSVGNNKRKPRRIVAQMVTARHAERYKMRHEQRGVALIFSHEHFCDSMLGSRPETNVDSRNLEGVLNQLGFNVTVHKDRRCKEIKGIVAAVAAQDHGNRDCILVALLTHGDHDYVYAKDESYDLESLWETFTADKCPSLAGKPKLFIVQACGRTSRNLGMRSLSSNETETDSDSRSNYKTPNHADFLITSCTISEHCSRSSPVLGSWFMQTLCAELAANGRTLDLLHLLTFVGQRVASCETNHGQQKQITCTYSTLTRVLRFAD